MKLKKLYSFLTLLTAFLCLGSGTMWGAKTVLSDGFEDGMSNWTTEHCHSSSVINSTAKRTGSNGFHFQWSTNPPQYLISKELSLPAGTTGVNVSFYHKKSSSSGTEKFYVGYSTTTNSSDQFTWLAEQSVSGSPAWNQYSTPTPFPAETKYIAIVYNANDQYGFNIDDVEITCNVSGPDLAVYDGTTALTTGHSYSFGLTNAGTTKTFTLSNPGTEATPVAVAHTGSFGTSLSAASIPAGGEATLTVTMPATTGSDVVTISSTATGIEDFVLNVSGTVKDPNKVWCNFSEGLPTGWTNSSYAISTSGAGEGTSGGGYAGQTNYSFIRMYTPKLKFTDGEKLYLLVAGHGTTASWNEMQIQYSADGSSWTTAKTVSSIVKGSWTSVEVSEIPAGSWYIGFYGRYVYFTDIYGGSISSAPKDIILTDKTTTSLTLNWTPAGSETSWILQHSTDNSTWSSDVEVNSKPFELTGLNPSTKYYVRVRANETGSDWSDAADFRTECATITSTDWTENFESATANELPFCWSAITVEGSTYPAIYASTSSSHRHNGSKGLLINNKHLKYGLAIFPEIANLNTLQVSFWHKEEGGTSNCGNLELGYLTNATDSTTFHLIKTCDNANDTWAQVTDINLSDVPSGARLAFRYIGKNTTYEYYTAVDDIAFSLAPACPKPTGLGYSEKVAHSVKLSWTSTASAWKVEYAENSSFTGSTIVAVTTNPYTLSGLKANTHYYVRVLTDCGASGESEPSNVIDFTTECDPIAMPFVEDFENGVFEDCWKADSYWTINSNAHEGSYCARFNAAAAADLVLPSVTLSDDAMLFYWHASSYPTGAVLVNGTSVQTIAKTTNGDWKKDSVDLSSYKGQTVTITFRGNYYYSNRYLYIDSVAVTYKPVAKPTNVVATPGNASATITWDSEEGTTWNLRYRVVGAADWTAVNDLTSKSKALSELTNGSNYEVQVQAVCSANRKSAWTASETFIPTACATVETVTFGAQTYNSIVVNWTTSGAGTWNLDYKISSDLGWNDIHHGLTEKTLTLEGLETGVEYTVQVSPNCGGEPLANTFTLTYSKPETASVTGATDAVAAASWSAVADAPNGYEYIVVARDAAEDWTSPTATNETSASLTGLNAGTEYDFYVRAVYGTNPGAATKAQFATIKIAPQNLQQEGESTTNSATFTWEANGAATKYQWSTDNSTWSEPITALTATAEGLTPGSDYTFYVRSYYAENVYSSAISLPFQTQCAAKSLGYSQNFDDASALPACWESTNFGSGNNKWNIGMSWYDYKSSWNSARFYAYKSSSSATADLITPAFELTEPALLKFYYKNESGVTAKVLIRISGEEDAEIWTASTKGSWAATPESIDLTSYVGKTAKFIFRAWGSSTTSSKSFYIDNVSVEAKPCPQLQNLTSVPTPDGATISWEQGVDENRYQYCVVDEGEAAAGWVLLDEDKFSVAISGKTFGNTYDCYVRSYCSATNQSEPLMVQFTPSCVAPSALTVSAVTDENATLSWTSNAKVLRYKAAGDADWTNETLDPIATSYNFSSLAGSTTYTVQVQAFCAADESEYWSSEFEFTTKCAARDAAELPLNEDFTAGVPACWESGTEIALSVVSEKLNFMGADEQIAILPKYNIDLNKLSVLMDYTTGANIELGYYTSLTAAYQTLGDISDDIELDLASIAPASAGYLAIRYFNGTGMTQANINSIRVRKTPTCVKPTNVAGTPGVGSAEISWTADSETAWNLQYKLASVSSWDGAGVTTVAITENPYNLTGLEQGVSYKVRVQANCGGEDGVSDWSDEASFTTNCEGIAALPWYADFSVALSNCWTVHYQSTSYIPSANAFSQSLTISGGKKDVSNNVVVLPAISASLTNAVMSFEYRGSTGASYAQLEVGYMTDKADTTTFVRLGEALAQASSYTEARVALNTVPANAYLAFRYAGGSSNGDQYIKDLRVINAYTLADADDNTATLAGLIGKTVDLTINRTLYCDGDYNTICLPFDLPTLDGTPLAGGELWAFRYGYVENGELLMRIAPASSIEAGVPYLITFASGANIVSPIFTNVTITKSVGVEVGQTDDAKFVGILKPEAFSTTGDDVHKKLFVLAGDQLAWADVANNLKSFRAYFRTAENVGGTPVSNHMPARIVRGEQVATGIDDVNGDVQSLKILENGRVVIIRNGVKYSVQGQVISK